MSMQTQRSTKLEVPDENGDWRFCRIMWAGAAPLSCGFGGCQCFLSLSRRVLSSLPPPPRDPVLPHCCTHHYVSHWDPPLTLPRVYTRKHAHTYMQVPVTEGLTINKADAGSKTVARYQSMLVGLIRKVTKFDGWGPVAPGMTCLQRARFLHDTGQCACVINQWTNVCQTMTLH